MMKLGMPGVHHEGKGTEMKKEGTATKPSTGEKSGTTPGTETKKKGGKEHSRYHSSEKVKEVQTALQEKGFNPGPIDGIMGPKTTKALASFQRQQNLYANGKLDLRTESELGIGMGTKGTEVPGEREKPKPDMKPAPPRLPPQRDQSSIDPQYQIPAPPVQSGADRMGVGMASAVEDIRAAQMALKNRGYDPGEINGMVSSQTQEALRHFQAANNLPVTGVFDIRTQAALGIVVRGTTNPDVPSPDLSYNNQGGPSAMEPEPAKLAEADVSDRLANAAEVIQDLTKAGDKKIPDELLARAEAIAVIPHVVKGAFGIGGRYGKGVVVQRLANGRWSAPAFISIGGGSFGAQIGVSATDLVLVFTDREAVNTITKGTSLKLGADAAVVAGPLGRTAEAGVTHDLKSAVYSYSRSKGLFAGVALDGAVLDLDKDDNRDVYGTTDARTILSSDAMAKNASVRNFVATMDRLIPATKPTRR
jgi:lipid-binding SYLF domain-containing protein